MDLLKRDRDLRLKYNNLIESECEERKLNDFITYLIDNYSSSFTGELLPAGKNKKEYLADVVQVLCACES